MRQALRDANARVKELERTIELAFTPYWGLVFKEGNENSRFAEQIEDYACLYTEPEFRTSFTIALLTTPPARAARRDGPLVPHAAYGTLRWTHRRPAGRWRSPPQGAPHGCL